MRSLEDRLSRQMGLSDLESSRPSWTAPRIIASAIAVEGPFAPSRLPPSGPSGSLRQGVKAVNLECACNYATLPEQLPLAHRGLYLYLYLYLCLYLSSDRVCPPTPTPTSARDYRQSVTFLGLRLPVYSLGLGNQTNYRTDES